MKFERDNLGLKKSFKTIMRFETSLSLTYIKYVELYTQIKYVKKNYVQHTYT